MLVCMATRTYHLGLVNDLSADLFIMALKKLISRRGRPQIVYSDNGTKLMGTNNELRKCLKQLSEEGMRNFCAPKRTVRNFKPQGAPQSRGAWARLVHCTN